MPRSFVSDIHHPFQPVSVPSERQACCVESNAHKSTQPRASTTLPLVTWFCIGQLNRGYGKPPSLSSLLRTALSSHPKSGKPFCPHLRSRFEWCALPLALERTQASCLLFASVSDFLRPCVALVLPVVVVRSVRAPIPSSDPLLRSACLC